MGLEVAQHSPIMHGLGPILHRGKTEGTKGSSEEGRTDVQTALLHAAAGMEPVTNHQDQAPSNSWGANPFPCPFPSISSPPEHRQDEPAAPCPVSPCHQP